MNIKIFEEVARDGMEIVFLAYVQPLGNNILFKYLGRLLLATDNYWPEFVAKLKKERNNRAHMLRFMGQ